MRIARVLVCLLLFGCLSAIPVQSRPQVALGVSVRFGPPVLPVYVQPVCPGPGFIWVPGYWAYGDDGYFWVPGTWVEPPEIGFLWTPGYWAFDDGFYIWRAGYWGPEVGFYGGIDYGFGYPGVGFYGGYWRGGSFFYNRAVTNINVEVVHNTYETRVFNNNTNVTRISFNGGPGGIAARPTSAELRAENQRHAQMTSAQIQQRQVASTNRTMLASVNHGRPDVAATPRPGQFPAHNGSFDTNRPTENAPVNHPGANKDRNRPDRPPTRQPGENAPVNPAATAKQQREMQKIQQRQDLQHQRMEQAQARQQQKQAQERQKLEQQQNREQQKLVQQRANQQRQQQLQQHEQQQRDQLERRQSQQTQKLQERQQQQTQRPTAKPSKPGKPHEE